MQIGSKNHSARGDAISSMFVICADGNPSFVDESRPRANFHPVSDIGVRRREKVLSVGLGAAAGEAKSDLPNRIPATERLRSTLPTAALENSQETLSLAPSREFRHSERLSTCIAVSFTN